MRDMLCCAPPGPLMNPYYEDDFATIYHGDAKQIVPALPGFVGLDAGVLTDPQYGIGFDTTKSRSRNSGLVFAKESMDKKRDPDWIPLQNADNTPFDPKPFLHFREVILWGGNNFADKLPRSRGWLVWDKLGDKSPSAFGDCELAWTSIDMSIRIFRQLWRGIVREGEENVANGPKLHPCQKPIALMMWCLGFMKADVILDPYMGSGTTLCAAKRLKRRAIGIDIEERYCEAARLEKEGLAAAA